GYDSERFPLDAPKQLIDERRRLDALTDLQRYKGCTVIEPGPAVVQERERLEESARPSRAPVVLNCKGEASHQILTHRGSRPRSRSGSVALPRRHSRIT